MKTYTPEELQANYNNFIGMLSKIFTGERLEKLLHMYSENELGTELAVAPASGFEHFHSSYIGGYIDHVMNVVKNAYKIKKVFEETIKVDFTDDELFFAAFHHDLGKLGDGKQPYYIANQSEWHRKNQGKLFNVNGKLQFMDVPDRAFWLLNQYGIKYTEREMIGIKCTDGLYDEATKKYFISFNKDMTLKTELPYILHWADNMSCRQERREWLNTPF